MAIVGIDETPLYAQDKGLEGNPRRALDGAPSGGREAAAPGCLRLAREVGLFGPQPMGLRDRDVRHQPIWLIASFGGQDMQSLDAPKGRSAAGQAELAGHSLMDTFLTRRRRRFALGNALQGRGLSYTSAATPVPLTSDEEAILAFAASG